MSDWVNAAFPIEQEDAVMNNVIARLKDYQLSIESRRRENTEYFSIEVNPSIKKVYCFYDTPESLEEARDSSENPYPVITIEEFNNATRNVF